MVILPLAYLGNTEWFTWLIAASGHAGGCVIDIGGNWVKQTVRNRCEIMTSGGVATLTVPVHGGSSNLGSVVKILTRDVRIDNSKRWQHNHWMSIVSAYRNSPFFDHYEDRFAPVYAKKFNFLTDLNLELLNILTSALGLPGIGGDVKISEHRVVALPGDVDLRGKKAFRRLNDLTCGASKTVGYSKYTQVFSDRTAFVPGLSIADLLFCEGPAAGELLLPKGRY